MQNFKLQYGNILISPALHLNFQLLSAWQFHSTTPVFWARSWALRKQKAARIVIKREVTTRQKRGKASCLCQSFSSFLSGKRASHIATSTYFLSQAKKCKQFSTSTANLLPLSHLDSGIFSQQIENAFVHGAETLKRFDPTRFESGRADFLEYSDISCI